MEVHLYLYDLSNGLAATYSEWILGSTGVALPAIWHSSVVVWGEEWYFDGATGIGTHPISSASSLRKPDKVVVIGDTRKTKSEWIRFNEEILKPQEFASSTYHALTHNCNHYSQRCVSWLTDGKCSIPADVLDVAETIAKSPLGGLIMTAITGAASVSSGAATNLVSMVGTLATPLPRQDHRDVLIYDAADDTAEIPKQRKRLED